MREVLSVILSTAKDLCRRRARSFAALRMTGILSKYLSKKSDRDGPLYHAVYDQRTSTERINSQSKELGIKRPKVRNIDSIRNLNTLTYLVINARALRRVRELNASLLSMPMKMIA